MELQVFKHEQFGEIKKMYPDKKDYFGYIYVLEYGNSLKIGSTNNPYARIARLKSNAEKYGKQLIGRVALSTPHTNFRDVEKRLHQIFADFRKEGTELFNLDLEDVLSNDKVFDIKLEDNSEKLIERAEVVTEGFKSFLLTGKFPKNREYERELNNKVSTFNFDDITTIRCIEIDNVPWFVVNDICSYFGITNRNRVLQNVSDEDKGGTQMHTPGGKQELTVINESGLYSLLFSLQPKKGRGISQEEISKKHEKIKKFKRWVTSEVLPTIRKHGAYMTEQTLEQALTSPDFLIKLATELKNEKDKNLQLQAQNSHLVVENTIMQPKADYFDELVDRNLLTGIRETAKQLKVKQNKFVEFLLAKKYLYRDKRGKLQPYADKNDGLFELKETINEKTQWSGTQLLITPKGRETFRLLFI
ncbi:phage antirepressor KilAC domain-containing protein [Aerococcaceae bacterium NML210727]|nr:phage antirepressor KilAC domain-containing protein [Aerococcaceae bacterium NML210727]MCW6655097.1 phage antirepressor KilAC domain-containing protein [Aerococcaceae bacterium NML201296]